MILRSLLALSLWLLPTALGSAWAHDSGGPRTYPLEWRGRGEVLLYRSCGCADGCWVAELRAERTKLLSQLEQSVAEILLQCPRQLLARSGFFKAGPESSHGLLQ